MVKHSHLLDTVAVAFLALVWGFSWPVTVVGLRFSDPLLLASLRSIVGGIILYFWRLPKTNKEPFQLRTLWITFIIATCWVGIPMAFTAWALQYISGGIGSILQSTTPFFVAIFAYFLLSENQFSFVKVAGLVVGFLGVVVLFSDDSTSSINGMAFIAGIAVLVTSVLNAFAQVFARKRFKGTDQLGFMMYILLISGFETLPLCFLSGLPRLSISFELVLAVLYLGVLGSAVAFVVYFSLLQRVDVVLLSMVAYVIPVVAVVAGIIWLSETMSTVDMIGSLLVLVGVMLATQYDAVMRKWKSRTLS